MAEKLTGRRVILTGAADGTGLRIANETTRYVLENPGHAALFFSTEDFGFTTGTELPVDGGISWR